MTEDIEDFFADNTHWVDDRGMASSDKPPLPPKSRAEMRRRRRRRQQKRVAVAISIVVIVALLAVGGFFGLRMIKAWRAANRADSSVVEDYAGPGDTEVSFTVDKGQSAVDVAKNLVKADIVKSEAAFTSTVSGNGAVLYPGTYTLKTHMKASDVVAILSDQSKASGFLEVRPGERLSDVIASAATLSGIDEKEFKTVVEGGGSGILPSEASGSFEGWLEPGTYDVQNRSVTEIIKGMVDARIAKLDQLGVPAGAKREDILKIASIAEAEVNSEEYYGKVTRVIDNRLDQGMTLGMDSAVAYGLGIKGTDLTNDQLADDSNPYNLRKHAGLPPTPISNPGDSAIKAALDPEQGDWTYFCTVNLKTGETKFTSSADEFEQFVAELRTWESNNPDY